SDPQIRPPLRPPLLPYTTLFRSLPVQPHAAGTLELHGLAGFVHELRPLDAQLSEQLDRRFPAGATCAPHAGGSLEGLAALRQLADLQLGAWVTGQTTQDEQEATPGESGG